VRIISPKARLGGVLLRFNGNRFLGGAFIGGNYIAFTGLYMSSLIFHIGRGFVHYIPPLFCLDYRLYSENLINGKGFIGFDYKIVYIFS